MIVCLLTEYLWVFKERNWEQMSLLEIGYVWLGDEVKGKCFPFGLLKFCI